MDIFTALTLEFGQIQQHKGGIQHDIWEETPQNAFQHDTPKEDEVMIYEDIRQLRKATTSK